MARKAGSPDSPETKPAGDPRARAVDALMALAAEMRWSEIRLDMIAEKAGLGLADLRDLFPSKGAILGAFIRRIDRVVLEGRPDDLADAEARDRVLDLMMRRFDALLPYQAALREVSRAFRDDLLGLAALNQQALNSWRYLLTSVGIDTEGPLGMLRVQGAVLVAARAFPVFLDEEDATLPRTMAALDRELKRGEWMLRRAEGVNRLLAPFRGFCRAARAPRDIRRDAAPDVA
jgi:AcrR family transcriptional regulator